MCVSFAPVRRSPSQCPGAAGAAVPPERNRFLLCRAFPIAEIVDLQLHHIFIRVRVVQRGGHSVINTELRFDARLLQPRITRHEISERSVLESSKRFRIKSNRRKLELHRAVE